MCSKKQQEYLWYVPVTDVDETTILNKYKNNIIIEPCIVIRIRILHIYI